MQEFGREILNFIGGTVRWIYGSIWRTLFNKPKFTYSEYINGSKNSKDYIDSMGHRFNNIIIGMIFLVIIISIVFRI